MHLQFLEILRIYSYLLMDEYKMLRLKNIAKMELLREKKEDQTRKLPMGTEISCEKLILPQPKKIHQ